MTGTCPFHEISDLCGFANILNGAGWGTTRLAHHLNNRDDIPEKLKPFHPSSIGYFLDNIAESGSQENFKAMERDLHMLQGRVQLAATMAMADAPCAKWA